MQNILKTYIQSTGQMQLICLVFGYFRCCVSLCFILVSFSVYIVLCFVLIMGWFLWASLAFDHLHNTFCFSCMCFWLFSVSLYIYCLLILKLRSKLNSRRKCDECNNIFISANIIFWKRLYRFVKTCIIGKLNFDTWSWVIK